VIHLHITDAIRRVIDGEHLDRSEAESVMNEIMTGKATDAQIACFLTALRMKSETVEELIGCARVIRSKASPVHPRSVVGAALSGTDREMLVDTCGTGGDATGTFNISTATSFVLAGAGVRVAKHGNRSVSSLCGSADVVEALGIRIDLAPEAVARCIDEAGIGFLYAPLLHDAMRYVMLARREMKIRTVFNLLGPLCNPARANAQVLGVYSEKLTESMAQVLCELGAHRAFVVHGSDGLDEITITGETKVSEVRDGEVRTYYLTPEDFGMPRATIGEIQGGDARRNAEIIREILGGSPGARTNVVLLNAAAGLVAGGKARSLREGVEGARSSIHSGEALSRLDQLIDLSAKLSRSPGSDVQSPASGVPRDRT
jgi:anthranilate phosphoribosyltransferase